MGTLAADLALNYSTNNSKNLLKAIYMKLIEQNHAFQSLSQIITQEMVKICNSRGHFAKVRAHLPQDSRESTVSTTLCWFWIFQRW